MGEILKSCLIFILIQCRLVQKKMCLIQGQGEWVLSSDTEQCPVFLSCYYTYIHLFTLCYFFFFQCPSSEDSTQFMRLSLMHLPQRSSFLSFFTRYTNYDDWTMLVLICVYAVKYIACLHATITKQTFTMMQAKTKSCGQFLFAVCLEFIWMFLSPPFFRECIFCRSLPRLKWDCRLCH